MVNLNKHQLDRLSEYLANLSLFFLATILSPFLSGNLIKLSVIIAGTTISLGFLVTSLVIIKK